MATEHRPVPLPPTGVRAPSAAVNLARRPLPEGAVKWSAVHLDHRNVPVQSAYPVPVDDFDRRTEHRLHACAKGHMVVDGQKVPCDYQAWLMPGVERYCPDHGREPLALVEVDKRKPLLPWRAIWDSVEMSARPAWALLGTAAAGAMVQAGHVSPLWTLLTAPALALGGYTSVRTYLTDRAIKNNRIAKGQKVGRRIRTIRFRARLGALAGAEAGAWLTMAAATNPHGLVGKMVWVALVPLWAERSQPWRSRVERQRGRPAAEPAPLAPVVDDIDPAALADAQTWIGEVVADSVALKHTTVDVATWEGQAAGDRRMVIRASRGAITEEAMKQAVPVVAGAFGVKKAAISWTGEYEDNPRTIMLRVEPNSPLNDIIQSKPVDIVDVEDAKIHMGMREDGSDLNATQFRLGLGAPSRIIIGTTGSGKTEAIRRLTRGQIKARVLRPDGIPTRLVAPFLHDPKRGADYGALRRLVCGFSIDSATLHMIVDAFDREMNRRYDALGLTVWIDDKDREREGERPFDPRTMGPILSLILDEFHVDAKDQGLMAKLDPFARKKRAAGIEITFASHLATIGDTGSQAFRDMAASGEAWLLRTTMGMNAPLVTGATLTGDPRALPREPGFVFAASGEEQTMKGRFAYQKPDEFYDDLYDDDNQPRVQPIEWPQETLDAFGKEFVEWMAASQNRQVGTAVPLVPMTLRSAAVPSSQQDLLAEDALRRILFESTEPLGRPAIIEHPLWKDRFNTTSTLTAVLRKGQDATPPWLLRHAVGKGAFGLSPAMRDQMAQAADELAENEGAAA
jgi:hypothetical protein